MSFTQYVDANTGITVIVTSQAPDAFPIGFNAVLTTEYVEIITVPQFKVPELVFGGAEIVEPGIGEVISPLILCNTTTNTVTVDVNIYRYATSLTFDLIKNLPIPAYDTIPIPINGQFFASGDLLQARCSANLAVTATLSYTVGQSEEYDVD
jgi:hypothetical protein